MYNFTACDTEKTDLEPNQTDYIYITIAPVAASGNPIENPATVTDPDDVVASLRIMVYDASDDLLVLNQFHDFTTQFQNPIQLELPAGTYHFVFIGNESSDPAFSGKLNSLTEGTDLFTDLHGGSTPYGFAFSAFSSDKNIPMASIYKDMIINTNGLSEDNGSTYLSISQSTPWEVAIKRLGVRVDITLQVESWSVASEFESLVFSALPENVYIAGIHNKSASQSNTNSLSILVSDGDNDDVDYTTGFQYNNSLGVYEWKKQG
ncbi:MAG: hypothetical protein LIP08_03435 [Bacteroides sp.]|nr:hypothetical protein [Bacteroides sp.]